MTTVELRRKQILCMLGVKEEDYTKEELKTIIQVGKIVYNLKEMEKLQQTTTNNTQQNKKREGRKMKKIIKKIKEVNTNNYYTDDTINELYDIAMEANLSEWFELFDEYIWEDETILEYIKETVDDFDSIIYMLGNVNDCAKYYYRNAYGNFRDVNAEVLDWLASKMIEMIEEREKGDE